MSKQHLGNLGQILEEEKKSIEELSDENFTSLLRQSIIDRGRVFPIGYLLNVKPNFDINREYIIDNRRDINQPFKSYIPIIFAAELGYAEIVHCLIEKGANPNVHTKRNGDIKTALMMATKENKIDVVKMLIDHGVDLNMQNHLGHSALFIASYCGNEPIAELLCENGADIDLCSKSNQTALDIAKEGGNKYIISLLQYHQNISLIDMRSVSSEEEEIEQVDPATSIAIRGQEKLANPEKTVVSYKYLKNF